MQKQEDKFTIRRATLKDLDVLVYQRRKMWEDIDNFDRRSLDVGNREYRVWARNRLGNGTLLGWVVESSDSVVVDGGCVWLQPIQPRPSLKKRRQPYLLSIYTEPSFRGRGVASDIVKAAVKWSRANGYPYVALHASDMGRGVYEKLGFEVSPETRLEFD